MRRSILLGLLAVLPVASLVTVAPAEAGGGVCAGVARCHVVAHRDVNGNGERDAIGVARRGEQGAQRGHVVVRVLTDSGHRAAARRSIRFWSGPLYQGAADVDGRAGREVFVGYQQGAHTQFFRSLTWRDGDLRTLDAPGRGHTWIIDGAFNVAYGWLRKADDDGVIRRRIAVRSETGDRFRGRVTKFAWTADGWDRRGSWSRSISEDQAFRWGGFHVPGLARW